jgi:hypothetical protein
MAAVAERDWAGIGEGWAPRPGFPWTHRAAFGALFLTSLGMVLALILAALFSDPMPVPVGGGGVVSSATTVSPESLKGAASLPATSRPGREVEPRTITLEASDLPAGAHVLKAQAASFSSNGSAAPPPSWDVVFQPEAGQPAGYDLSESLAVVYPSDAVAAAALQSLAAAERAAQAKEQTPGVLFGDRMTVWLETVPSRTNEVVVRVTWQSMNVVGQVSMFGPPGSDLVQRTLTLAQRQQDRIGSPVPLKKQS